MNSDLREALAAVIGGRTEHAIRQEIAASWRRATEQGLDPDRFAVPNIEVDDDAYLIRAAGPVAAELASEVADARNAVLLTDGDGGVL
jgi:transcriptional regulator of acetoin/glycerol metabolism